MARPVTVDIVRLLLRVRASAGCEGFRRKMNVRRPAESPAGGLDVRLF
jgi:hypothetical protein